ncbi:MAG: tRNA (adenosine(37)-N6)-threonylcarbamoyltransferase complex ATPase subunit type 1 TsaE [Pseudomonadota bacterium]
MGAGRTPVLRTLADVDATIAFGAALARALTAGERAAGASLWLEGDLGAGKTTLVRGLLRGLGHQGSVKSPTYTLVEPYDVAAGRLYHLDLYRLRDPEELEFLGVRDLARELADGATVVVEWPARGAGFLPAPDLVIELVPQDAGRCVRLEARSARGVDLLDFLETAA